MTRINVARDSAVSFLLGVLTQREVIAGAARQRGWKVLTSSIEQLDGVPLWVEGLALLVLLTASLSAGRLLRARSSRLASGERKDASAFDGYIVSAVLGLLALLLGFTFSLAIQRFEERRQLIVSEANDIGTAYLRVQMLSPPHRERLGRLILAHLDHEVRLAEIGYPDRGPLREEDERVLTQVWAATVAALASPTNAPLTIPLTSAINSMIDLNSARRAARAERIPSRVFAVLWVYLLSVAGVLGYEIGKGKKAFLAYFVLALMTISLLLVVDIDRPTSGAIAESQRPMLQLRDSLARQPPEVFDQFRNALAGH